jgi:hypothetical protein
MLEKREALGMARYMGAITGIAYIKEQFSVLVVDRGVITQTTLHKSKRVIHRRLTLTGGHVFAQTKGL